jgi:hypothetical protein
MDEREQLRAECQEDLEALRLDPNMPERAFRLFEKLCARLTRLETGSFPETERPTEPERGRTRKSSGAIPAVKPWSSDKVREELEKGKKGGEGS